MVVVSVHGVGTAVLREQKCDFYQLCGSQNECDDTWTSDDSIGTQDDVESSSIEINPSNSNTFDDKLFGLILSRDNQESTRNTADSVCGLSSLYSETSSSNISTIPFPFYDRPELPHVDEFILKNNLHYSNIRSQNMQEHNAKTMNRYCHITGDIISTDWNKIDVLSPSIGKRKLRVTKSQMHLTCLEDSHQSDTTLSTHQIKLFVEYVLLLMEDGKCRGKSALYLSGTASAVKGIYYHDIVTALRMHVRNTNKHGDRMDYIEDLLMASFDDLLVRSNLTHIQWFEACSQSIIGGDNQMNTLTFNRSIRNICEEHGLPLWTNSDLKVLRLHMSLEGESYLSIRGIMWAFRKFRSTNEEKVQLEAARPIILTIKSLMHAKKIRVIDFFLLIATSIQDAVSPKMLVTAIGQILLAEDEDNVHNDSKSSTRILSLNSLDELTPVRWGSVRHTNVRSPKKGTILEPLQPLSMDVVSKIAIAQEDIEARLYMAANVTNQANQMQMQPYYRSPMDSLSINTISSGMKSIIGNSLLKSPPLSRIETKNNGIYETDPLHYTDLKPTKLCFTFSSNFPSIVQQKTRSLVSNVQQYNLRRDYNLSRFAA